MPGWNGWYARLKRFAAGELWQLDLAVLPPWRRAALRQLQLWVLVGREFIADRCLLHATALAFTTLLSLVPLLALMFAVLKSFGVQNRLEPLLLKYLAAGSEPITAAVITYINNTNVSQLGAIGLVSLILTVLSLLSGIEKTFNAIWGVNETRTISQRFASYFSVVTIGPVFVVAAMSMTGSLKSQLLVRWLIDLALVGDLLIVLLKVLPFLVMWLVFAGLYMAIPNARVTFRAALAGGIFGGTLWQLSQWLYVDFQFGVVRYNAIYGSLAALPIFMVWLYLAWAIVLLGLEVAFAAQNFGNLTRDLHGGKVSFAGRARIVLAVLIHLCRRFLGGQAPPTAEELAAELQIPPRLLRGLLTMLQRRGLVAEVSVANGAIAYLPAREPARMRLAELFGTLAEDGTDYVPPPRCRESEAVAGIFAQLTAGGRGALGETTLGEVVLRLEAGQAEESRRSAGDG